jgi:DNA-nicking Smr family endonuclease
VEDMMNRDFDHLMATNYGSTDTQRYANALSSNFLHLNKKINNVAKQFHEMIGRGLLPDFVEISSVVLEQEDIAIRTLMAARSRALPSNITIEQLSNRAYSAMQRHHFSNAVKNFSFAIDKLMIETPISRMDDAEKRRLIKFYAKRAECNLELAKANHSEEFILKVLEDCSFVLETGVFVRAFVEAETEICACLKKLLKKAQELKEEIGTYGVESRTTTVVTETANQRRRRRRQEREMEKEKLMEIVEENQIIDASLCSELGDVTKTTEKLAINAYSEEGECPICSTRWCDFMEPKVAAILPCAHACCAECLLLYHKSCNDEDVEEQDRCSFGCPLCRKNLDEELFSKLAQAFVNKRLIDSFNFLAKSLPYEQEEMDKILLSLIKTYDFDLSKVEYSLFNMVGLVDKSPDLNLNYEEKQQFYNEARAPVVLLYSELAELREKLHYIDHESEDGKETRKKLEKVNINLRVAMRNASSTIFERVNSKENNILIGEDGTEVHCVDLHGLHLNEAKEIVKENILPVLMVVNQIMIITGRGKHSQNGKAVLKNAIKEYFGQLQFRCQDIVKNEGAFYVYSNNME